MTMSITEFALWFFAVVAAWNVIALIVFLSGGGLTDDDNKLPK